MFFLTCNQHEIAMERYYNTPVLVAEASKGNKKYWQGFACKNDSGCYTQTESWQEKANGMPSKTLISAPKAVLGKNIGRSNETSPHDQARLEIMSNADRKRNKGYHEIGEKAETRPLPMLAHSFEKRSHNVDWDGGVYVQPKLDGTRMLFDGRVGWSRQGKEYIPKVIAHLQINLPEGVILDGELMLPQGEFTFQDSIRAIKKYRPGVSDKLVFHVYDLCSEKGTFTQRTQAVAHMFYDTKINLWDNPGFELVRTFPVLSVHTIKNCHEQFVKEGYEGIMIRNASGLYKAGHRSADLQKLKHFMDDEYEIVSVGEGSGKEEGCAIFTCKTEAGQEFNVRPTGTTVERQRMFNQGEELVGELLTVRFQELTDDGIPRFPVGVSIRDYEHAGAVRL